MAHRRDPRTKEELLDRMLSFDFDGDIRHLGAEPAQLSRIAPNRLELKFPISGRCYELSVKLPRDAQPRQPEAKSFTAQDGDGEREPDEPKRRTSTRPARSRRQDARR